MKKWLLGAVALLAAGVALAQVPGLNIASPTGLEQIEVFVPSSGGVITSPQKTQVTLNQIRNTLGYQLVATGTTVTTQMLGTVQSLIATGTITTWNVNLPTAPADGLVARISCPGGNTTTLTIAATLPSGVAIVGANPTSCTESSGGGAAFQYSLSANTWYRV
jgi:hypothetical protein